MQKILKTINYEIMQNFMRPFPTSFNMTVSSQFSPNFFKYIHVIRIKNVPDIEIESGTELNI